MEIEILARELVKPSSPTPAHLQTYKISLIDQLLPVEHASAVFFYPFNPDQPLVLSAQDKVKRLKESLSETLTHFYPLAGKIKDDDLLSVDCNDEGAYYVEARAKKLDLSTFVENPDCQVMHRFLPSVDPADSKEGTFVFMFQVTIFDDGGIAVSVKGSHKIIDGATFCSFLRTWTAVASSSGSAQVIPPSFIASSLYPQDPSLPKDSTMFYFPTVLKQGKCITKRFVFDSSALTKLKEECSSQQQLATRPPSRVEAVSAILWKCIMSASATRYGSKRASLLCQPADLRRRMSPPLPDHSMGNLIWTLAAQCKAEASTELACLVSYIREAKATLDNHVTKQLEGDQGYSRVPDLLKELGEMFADESADYIAVASWYRIGMYEADFGWGKPVWLSPGCIDPSVVMFPNVIFLMETSGGSGIEAWLTLDQRDMAILEHDPQLLSFASVEPSPCEV